MAKDLGGRTQPGSGNQWHSKADVKTPDHLVECKYTEKASYSLKAVELEKLLVEAMKASKEPILCIQFCHPKTKRQFGVLPWEDVLSLLQERTELNAIRGRR